MPGLEDLPQVLLPPGALAVGCSDGNRATVVRARAADAALVRPRTSLHRHRLRQRRSPPAPRLLWRGTAVQASEAVSHNIREPAQAGEGIAGGGDVTRLPLNWSTLLRPGPQTFIFFFRTRHFYTSCLEY